MTPLDRARAALRDKANRTDGEIIMAAETVMTHGGPVEWHTANELRRAALLREAARMAPKPPRNPGWPIRIGEAFAVAGAALFVSYAGLTVMMGVG